MNDAFWSFEVSPSLLLFLQNYNSHYKVSIFGARMSIGTTVCMISKDRVETCWQVSNFSSNNVWAIHNTFFLKWPNKRRENSEVLVSQWKSDKDYFSTAFNFENIPLRWSLALYLVVQGKHSHEERETTKKIPRTIIDVQSQFFDKKKKKRKSWSLVEVESLGEFRLSYHLRTASSPDGSYVRVYQLRNEWHSSAISGKFARR